MVTTPEPEPKPQTTTQRWGQAAEEFHDAVEHKLLGPSPGRITLLDFNLFLILGVVIGGAGGWLALIGIVTLCALIIRMTGKG